MNENYTLGDIAAVTRNEDGLFGGGNSWLIILFFLFLFGGGNMWGNNRNCATQADVRAATDMQTMVSKLDGIANGTCDSTYAINNAINNGFNGVDRSLCGISREIGDLKFTVANEACETRHAMCQNTRDIIDNANANSRAILDFLTNDKIATLTAENQSLKQNAYFAAAQEAQTAEILRRLNPTPVPAYSVPNPNCCYGGVGFGNTCGCGA